MRFGWLMLVAALPCTGLAFAQQPDRSAGLDPALVEADRKIIAEIRHHAKVMENLEYLSDVIGPRLTGSENLTRANDWTLARFKEYGLVNTHLEPWKNGTAWTRGSADAKLIEPTSRRITVAAAGWSPGTEGTVRGEVVAVEVRSEEDLAKYRGRLKNAIVLTNAPANVALPAGPTVDGIPTPLPPEAEPGAAPRRRLSPQLAAAVTNLFAEEHVACVLHDSAKEHSLLNMGMADYGRPGTEVEKVCLPARVPTAFTTHEDYALLWRLLKRGTVRMEVSIHTSFSPGDVTVYNTVAELPGSDKPNEVVLIGAHLDSWDLGSGTTDNGTGSMAVLEAARALQTIGFRPRRTIRFVLFTGEEEGLLGSKAYATAHEKEMDQISAVLVHDLGTGRVTSINLQGRYDCGAALDVATRPLAAVGFEGLKAASQGGTDHLSFVRFGVPAFACGQDRAEYRKTHHSQSDTFDKAWKDDLLQGSMVLAVWAANVASLPDLLPRGPKTAK